MPIDPGDADQTTACPRWCDADHAEQHHSDDYWHTSAGQLLPAVELVTSWSGGGARFDVMAVELEIGIEQRLEGAEPFIRFGVGEERARNFRLSLESTKRLAHALSAHVVLADGQEPPDAPA